MSKFVKLSAFCLITLPLQLLSAPLSSDSTNTNTNRVSFEEFEELAQAGDTNDYLKLVNAFSKYPLFPYAKANYLSATLDIGKKAVINQFIEEYDGAPFVPALKLKWVHYLANNNYRDAFFDVYQLGADSALDCRYLGWQLELSSLEQISDQIADVWVTNKSLPKECDGLFSAWYNSDLLKPKDALQRVKLAALSGNYKLARYLKRYLPSDHQYLVDLWIKASKRPKTIYRKGFFLFHNDNEVDILKVFSSKLAFANPERFYQWWGDKKSTHRFEDKTKVYIDKKSAIALAVNKSPMALDLLNALPNDVVDESVKQWKLARALATNNWQVVLDTLDSLPELYQVDPSVVFWRAKAELEVGDKGYANRLLSELAERRDYYGFMAASSLDVDLNIRHEPITANVVLQSKIKNNDTFKRALALYHSNSLLRARKEWNYLARKVSEEELLVASQMAAEHGWVDRPILALSKVDYLNDVELRFPLAFNQIIQQQAERTGLPASLIFAIIRRESSFIEDAFSSAGAAGLMQIKPATASVVARKRVSKYELFEPETNLKYATSYLEKLLDKTDQHLVLAAASYNAGYHRVKKWLPKEAVNADAWIESIPYKETRNYVKAVLAYKQVYQNLLQEESTLTADITTLQVKPEI
ncbi:transglycosylase SLT domain-containing protein [Psychrosphaera sp.]|nr:transglycosylase SLT domain-containing protein [Psychrosphaera sp.]